MARLEIRPFSDEFLGRRGRAARCAATAPTAPSSRCSRRSTRIPPRRRPRSRRCSALDGASGAVALRDGRVVGYLLGVPRERRDLGRERLGRARRARRRGGGGSARPLRRGGAALGRRRRAPAPLRPRPRDRLRRSSRRGPRVGFGQQHAFGIQEVPDGDAGRTACGCATAARRRRARSTRRRSSPTTRRSRRSSRAACRRQDREELRAELLEDLAQGGDRRPGRSSATAEIVGAFQIVPVELSSVHTGLARPPGAALLGWAATLPERARLRRRPRADGGDLRLGARARPRDDGHRLARDEPARVALLAAPRLPADLPPALPAHPVVPCGSRSCRARASRVVNVPDDARRAAAAALRREAIADVGAAVRDALRFPLSGRAARGARDAGRHGDDRRRAASAAAAGSGRTTRAAPRSRRRSRELERLGVPSRQQTILVAGGLERRAGQRELEALVAPRRARRFRGRVEVHDAEAPDLVHLADAGADAAAGQPAARRDRPRRLRHGRRDRAARRARRAARGVRPRGRCARRRRLLAARDGRGRAAGSSALALERALAARVPVIGASLVLNPPRLQGRFRGYPYERRVARAPRDLAAAPVLAPPRPGCAAACSRASGASSPRSRRSPGRRRSRTRRRSCAAIARRATRLERAARRDRDRHAVEAPPPAARAAEPDHGRDRRARACAAALARRLPGRRGRHRDRAPPALAPLRSTGRRIPTGSLFHALRDGRTTAELADAEQRGRDGRARRSPPTAPAAPATRCCRTPTGRLPARARPARRRRDRRLPRPRRPRARSASSPRTAFAPRSRWRTAAPAASARIGYLLGPPYFPLEVGGGANCALLEEEQQRVRRRVVVGEHRARRRSGSRASWRSRIGSRRSGALGVVARGSRPSAPRAAPGAGTRLLRRDDDQVPVLLVAPVAGQDRRVHEHGRERPCGRSCRSSGRGVSRGRRARRSRS